MFQKQVTRSTAVAGTEWSGAAARRPTVSRPPPEPFPGTPLYIVAGRGSAFPALEPAGGAPTSSSVDGRRTGPRGPLQ